MLTTGCVQRTAGCEATDTPHIMQTPRGIHGTCADVYRCTCVVLPRGYWGRGLPTRSPWGTVPGAQQFVECCAGFGFVNGIDIGHFPFSALVLFLSVCLCVRVRSQCSQRGCVHAPAWFCVCVCVCVCV